MIIFDKIQRDIDTFYEYLNTPNSDGSYTECNEFISDNYLVGSYEAFDPKTAFDPNNYTNGKPINKMCFLKLIGMLPKHFDEFAPGADKLIEEKFNSIYDKSDPERYQEFHPIRSRFRDILATAEKYSDKINEKIIDKIVNDYSFFGWKWIEKEYDLVFSNLVHLTFERPHRIENKDSLQYIKVCYEQKLNDLADLDRRKNFTSSLLFVFLALVFIFVCGASVYFFYKSKFLLGGIFVFLSLVCVFLTPLIGRLRVKENRKRTETANKLQREIENTLKEVAFISGVKEYEK
jgi:hypothetical protein